MRSTEQKVSDNRNKIEIENRFQKRIYIKSNIIRKYLCQMINCVIFQDIYILHCGISWCNVLMELRDVVDYRFLTNIWGYKTV